MKQKTTQQEVEEIVSLMFPNQFLQRDLNKLETIYIAGITKGLSMAKTTIAKCGIQKESVLDKVTPNK